MNQPIRFRTRVLELPEIQHLSREMQRIAVDRGGIPLMAPKGVMRAILVEDVPTRAANIIKQEILARGGDLATPWSCADYAAETVHVIVLGNVVTLRSLVAKLFRQTVYDLPAFADALQTVLMHTVPGYLPVARQPGRQGLVVEETLDDLFGGRIPTARGRATAVPPLLPPHGQEQYAWTLGQQTYLAAHLCSRSTAPAATWPGAPAPATVLTPLGVRARIQHLAAQGAQIVCLDHASMADSLAEASPDNLADPAGRSDAHRQKQVPSPLLAVATRHTDVAALCLDAGAHLMVSRCEDSDDALLPVLAQYRAPLVLQDQEPLPADGDVMTSVFRHFWDRMDRAVAAGVSAEQLILAPGLGRQQATGQTCEVLRRLRELRSLGRPLWVDLTPLCAADGQDPATQPSPMQIGVLVSVAIQNGADFICAEPVDLAGRALRTADAIVRDAATADRWRG